MWAIELKYTELENNTQYMTITYHTLCLTVLHDWLSVLERHAGSLKECLLNYYPKLGTLPSLNPLLSCYNLVLQFHLRCDRRFFGFKLETVSFLWVHLQCDQRLFGFKPKTPSSSTVFDWSCFVQPNTCSVQLNENLKHLVDWFSGHFS